MRCLLDDLACRGDSVTAWHLDIHQHQVGLLGERHLNASRPAAGLADHPDLRIAADTVSSPARSNSLSSTTTTRTVTSQPDPVGKTGPPLGTRAHPVRSGLQHTARERDPFGQADQPVAALRDGESFVPSSTTRTSVSSAVPVIATRAEAPGAWRTTLVRASCTVRNTSGASTASSSRSASSSTDVPADRIRSTRACRSRTVLTVADRSGDSRFSSANAPLAVVPITRNDSLVPLGSTGQATSAAPDCTAINPTA